MKQTGRGLLLFFVLLFAVSAAAQDKVVAQNWYVCITTMAGVLC